MTATADALIPSNNVNYNASDCKTLTLILLRATSAKSIKKLLQRLLAGLGQSGYNHQMKAVEPMCLPVNFRTICLGTLQLDIDRSHGTFLFLIVLINQVSIIIAVLLVINEVLPLLF